MTVLSGSGRAGIDLDYALFLYALSGACAISLHYAAEWLTASADTTMLSRLQQRLHDTILAMPATFYDQHDAAELGTIVLQDAAGCQPLLREFISAPVTQGVAIVSAIALVAGSLHALGELPALLLAFLVFAVVGMQLLAHITSRQLASAHGVQIKARAALAAEFENSVAAPLQIRAMGAECGRAATFGRAVASFTTSLRDVRSAAMRAIRVQGTLPGVLQVVVLATLIVVTRGDLPLGTAITVFLLTPRIILPIAELLSFEEGIKAIGAQAQRVGELLDVNTQRPPGGAPFPVDHSIVFEDVTYTPPGASGPVLRGLNHTFKSGKITALVGRSGCGKSTVLSLAAGLRAPARGVVRIGGVPVDSIAPDAVREHVGFVAQFPLFIADSVRANIRLGAPDATDAEIEPIVTELGLWPALLRLGGSQPLDAMLPRGLEAGLSGGEHRRLAIARALLRRPGILLLDEPTDGLDGFAIAAFEAALRARCDNATILIVDFDLDCICRIADFVCVLQDGAVAECGVPSVLAEMPSLFRTLLWQRRRAGDMPAVDSPSPAEQRDPAEAAASEAS